MVLMIVYIMVVVICYAAQSIMAYGSTPYVGMTLKKMAATLKITNDTLEMSAIDWSTASMSHIRHYRVVP